MKITRYDHKFSDGKVANVAVFEKLKGKHREYCLCFQGCKNFKPGTEENCEIAQSNFANCVKYNTVQPVLECPKFES